MLTRASGPSPPKSIHTIKTLPWYTATTISNALNKITNKQDGIRFHILCTECRYIVCASLRWTTEWRRRPREVEPQQMGEPWMSERVIFLLQLYQKLAVRYWRTNGTSCDNIRQLIKINGSARQKHIHAHNGCFWATAADETRTNCRIPWLRVCPQCFTPRRCLQFGDLKQ